VEEENRVEVERKKEEKFETDEENYHMQVVDKQKNEEEGAARKQNDQNVNVEAQQDHCIMNVEEVP
jgi:hypothetical protein